MRKKFGDLQNYKGKNCLCPCCATVKEIDFKVHTFQKSKI